MNFKSEQSQLDDAYDRNQEDYCTECGGHMTWCDLCNMWSRTCCDEYGTCMCS